MKEDAFRSLLVSFTQKCQKKLLKGKYSLVARCYGSAADIFRNPDDSDTFFEPNGKSTRGFNEIHINAFFSVLDKKFNGSPASSLPANVMNTAHSARYG